MIRKGIHISAKENHIDELIQHIKDEFDFSAITNFARQVLANQRQVQLLEKASQSLNVAIQQWRMVFHRLDCDWFI